MSKEQQYRNWVEKVIKFLNGAHKRLKIDNLACSVLQSRIELHNNLDVVFIGCNAHETSDKFVLDENRFWQGNPFFYNNERHHHNDAMYHSPWKIWHKPYNALVYHENTTPMEMGNYVFMNAYYFGSNNLDELKNIERIKPELNRCLQYTEELIHGILKPRLIVCFSIPDCFDELDKNYQFENVEESLFPVNPRNNHKSSKCVKKAIWKGTRIIGIPHPSQAISNDDWGALGYFILEQYLESTNRN